MPFKANLYHIPTPPPGRLSTMPRPRGGDWLVDEMQGLRRAGVDVLVCLLTSTEREELGLSDEPAAAEAAGLTFHALPIVDFDVPDHGSIERLADHLLGRLRAGDHIAVHCRGGIGRSSLVAASLLVRLDVPAGSAWTQIAEARGVRVPETEEQRRWLDDHVRRISRVRPDL